jgi:glycosyltransferase involved in cell wall biosynthesis
MNILMISTADSMGGAAKSAYRLMEGLRQAGHTCRMLVKYKSQISDQEVDCIIGNSSLWSKAFLRLLDQAEYRTGLQYRLIPWGERFLKHPFYREADLVHLHNIHGGFFPIKLVPRMSLDKPLVWTLHDMWAMTGHCPYPSMNQDCGHWRTGCSTCGHLEDYPPLGRQTSDRLLDLKKRYFAAGYISAVIAPSRWMAQMARESLVFGGHRIVTIPYGVNSKLFRPAEPGPLRRAMGLKAEDQVILFSALELDYERKGGRLLMEALRLLPKYRRAGSSRLVVLCVGKPTPLQISPDHCKVVYLGFINSDEMMNLALNMADLYVHPALADNLPNAVLESLACGRPVVAFAVGGLPDMVRPGQTGWLAAPGDADSLARKLAGALDDHSGCLVLGRMARSVVEKEYALQVQAGAMEDLYNTVVEEPGRGAAVPV